MPKRYIRRPDGTLIEDSGAVVDSSLTISGAAADAKAVGDALIKKLDADRLNGAVEDALRQAKEAGEFDGEPGAPGTTPHIGANGNWWIGNTDTGVKAQGEDGDDYNLTEADKAEIASAAAKLVDVPSEGEYRLLKTITLTEEVSQIYETFDVGYDGIKCIVENGVIATGGLPFYITVGKGNSLRGCGVNNFKSSNIMWFTAEKANGIWDFDVIHGSQSGVSTRVGALTTKDFASTNAVSDGFGVAWDKLHNLRLYSYAPNNLPVGMIVKIYVLGGDDNA